MRVKRQTSGKIVAVGLVLATITLATIAAVWKNSIETNSAGVVFAQLIGAEKADKEEKPAGQSKITTGCQKKLDDLRFELFQTRQVIIDFAIFLRLQVFLRTAVSQDPRIDPAITQSLEGMGNFSQRLFDALKWLGDKIEADQQNGKVTPDLDIWLKSAEKAIALYLEYLIKLRDFAPDSIPDNRYEKLKEELEEFEKFIKNARVFWETQLETGPFLPPEEWLRAEPLNQLKTESGSQPMPPPKSKLKSELKSLLKDERNLRENAYSRTVRLRFEVPAADGIHIYTGSGVYLNDGFVLTNNHVIKGKTGILDTFSNGKPIRSYNVKLVKIDPSRDLALLYVVNAGPELRGLDEKPIMFFDKVPRQGTKLYNYSCAEGAGLTELICTTATGIAVSIKEKTKGKETGDFFEFSLDRQSRLFETGRSGSGIWTEKGELAGLCSKAIVRGGGLCVAPNEITEFLKDFIEK